MLAVLQALRHGIRKEVTAKNGHLFNIMQLSDQGRAGVAQQQGEQDTGYDADKAGDHPQAAAAGKFSGDVQPAQA